MDEYFKGKKALITGAGRGIGRALCLKLHEMGANVVALSKTASNLDDLIFQASGDGNPKKITKILFDLASDDVSCEVFEKMLAPYEPFHFLVNNAGVFLDENFLDLTPTSFDHLFNVNLRSALFLTQYVTKAMISHNIKGSVVNISSQASKFVAMPGHLAYGVSKAALDALTKRIAWELGSKGIRVNSVNPTVVMTEMGIKNWSDPVKAQLMLDKIPLDQFAKIQDIVDAVIFLLSDQSRMTTGHCLPVDGGATI